MAPPRFAWECECSRDEQNSYAQLLLTKTCDLFHIFLTLSCHFSQTSFCRDFLHYFPTEKMPLASFLVCVSFASHLICLFLHIIEHSHLKS